ncbi:polyubiquitin-like [Silurus meridionalis]|uniref:polyubiquitin-like n=1 Tax=Silurus meridionalis TaxID=175797 RepID=UPI001EE9FE8D|nr:polyubiquitin-like [Silurus meridionalis]
MMELMIKDLNGKSQIVNVLPNATIGELKQHVAPHFEVRASLLKLSASNGQILDHDEKTVRDYGLSSGSTVMLLISSTPVPFQVFVKNEKGQKKTYDITDSETVDQLMRKIYQIEGTPLDQQRLIYNGQQLESGRRLLDYNIQPGSTIYMTLRLRGG